MRCWRESTEIEVDFRSGPGQRASTRARLAATIEKAPRIRVVTDSVKTTRVRRALASRYRLADQRGEQNVGS